MRQAMEKAKVKSMYLIGRTEKGRIYMRAGVQTPLYKSATQGVAVLAKQLPDMEIDSWPVTVTLDEALANEFRLGGWLLNDTKSWKLPKYMRLYGKIGDLRVEVNQKLRNEIIAGWAANKVISVPVGILENTSGVIDLLPVPNPLNFIFPRKK